MPFINKKSDKKSDSKDRFKKKNRPEGDDDDDKKKFDDKPAPSDEDDDSRRGKNKFKKGDDEDRDDKFKGRDDDGDEDDDNKNRFGKKKKSDDQDVTKDTDQDTDDTESTSVDKKRGDEVEDDDEDDEGKGKKSKGGCNCGRQIEVNPPLRTQYEQIAALPPSLQADAVAALAEQETEKILSALAEKAEDHGVDFAILFEVFRRGWFCLRGSDHLSEAEIGFNRVNSFLAGGLARRLDADLIMEMDDYQKRKDERRKKFEVSKGMKLKTCPACNGSGHYDSTGSPKCASCNGTGKVRESIKEDMGINTPSDDMVCDRDEPTPGEKLKSKLRRKKK